MGTRDGTGDMTVCVMVGSLRADRFIMVNHYNHSMEEESAKTRPGLGLARSPRRHLPMSGGIFIMSQLGVAMKGHGSGE